jgi:hypothetical protein
MTRGLVRLLAVAPLLAGGLWATGTSWPRAGHAAPPAERGFAWQGTASCASAACHNANGPPGTRGSEYTTWVTLDPHAQAYEVLHTGRSRRIEKNFRQLAHLEDAHAERDDLCLKCHALDDSTPHRASFSVEDGVGCESCHGPAEHWLTQHYQRGWQSLTNADKAALGFRLTGGDLVHRAEVCVTCHIGAPDREVNHDLIAAGHPVLRFEFGAYHANLPKHWNMARDKAGRPDFEAQAWAVGQVVSARAALELLAARAKPDSGKVWPEFAEYGCFSCHHDLHESSWRQQSAQAGHSAGSLRWGTWYFSFALREALAIGGVTNAASTLDALKTAMELPYPDRQRVHTLAKSATSLRPQAIREDTGRLLQRADQMLGVSGDRDRAGERSWDSAAQRYLAGAALQNALSDLGVRELSLLRRLRDLKKTLSFPPGYASPHAVRDGRLQTSP